MPKRSGVFPILLVSGLVLLVAVKAASPALATPASIGDLQIAIVWPTDGQGHPTGVAQSRAVNVSVWPTGQVSCNLNRQSLPGGGSLGPLWMAKDNEPVELVQIAPNPVQRTDGGVTFPRWEYDNLPADLADEPASKYTFVAGLFGPFDSNIWVHAADARTYLPAPVMPTGKATEVVPGQIDSRIQIVWPHDAEGNYAPVDQATFVNVAVEFFAHGTLLSADPQPETPYFLRVAAGNGGPGGLDVAGQRITYEVNGQTFPRWVFNDVPVQPGQQYHFIAPVLFGKLLSPYVSVWTHAADARTMLPVPVIPLPCIP